LESIDLEVFIFAAPVIQVLFGKLEIRNSSRIYDEDVFISAYSSEVSITDSEISHLEIDQAHIEVVGSLLTLNNLHIHNITNLNNKEFIRVAFDSEIFAENITFQDSQSSLFTLISSKANVRLIRFENINGGDLFIQIRDCESITLDRVE